MGDQEQTSDNNRCRAKLTMNSKGLYQLEATAEFDEPSVTAGKLIDTLNEARELAQRNGYKLVESS